MWWRPRNYKNRFWFQEGTKNFSRARTVAGGPDVAPLPRGYSARRTRAGRLPSMLPMTREARRAMPTMYGFSGRCRPARTCRWSMVMDEFKNVVKGVHLPTNRVAKLIDNVRFFRVLWKIICGLHTTTPLVKEL